MDELTRERFGAVVPEAELERLPRWRYSDGRPDTAEKVRERRRELDVALYGWWLRNRRHP